MERNIYIYIYKYNQSVFVLEGGSSDLESSEKRFERSSRGFLSGQSGREGGIFEIQIEGPIATSGTRRANSPRFRQTRRAFERRLMNAAASLQRVITRLAIKERRRTELPALGRVCSIFVCRSRDPSRHFTRDRRPIARGHGAVCLENFYPLQRISF